MPLDSKTRLYLPTATFPTIVVRLAAAASIVLAVVTLGIVLSSWDGDHRVWLYATIGF